MLTVSIIISVVAIIAATVAIEKVATLNGRVDDAIVTAGHLAEKCRQLELRAKEAFDLDERISRIETNVRATIAGVNQLSLEKRMEKKLAAREKLEPKPKDPTLSSADTQVCKRCGREKPIEDFVKDKRQADGHGAICKECDAARKREARRKM
jgi:CRISPR/Cas system-associated protein Cas10 (large subunit of type III CRISPR-Cas system)